MDPQHVFDRVLSSLGFAHQIQLAVALGRKPTAAWNWRKSGFPKSVCADLQILAGQIGRPLPPEFYESTGIPSPSNSHPNQIEGA